MRRPWEQAEGFFFVYSITSRSSFKEIRRYFDEVQRVKKITFGMLIANKEDLGEEREVSREEGEQLAKEKGIPFLETSAKASRNVDEMFQILPSLMLSEEPNFKFEPLIKGAKY